MGLELFLRAVEGPAASGVELRNEPAFHAIERMLEDASRRARTDGDGNINLTATVDWGAVLSAAEDLSATGRDLRLLVVVARATANLEGPKGLAEGLGLIAQSLEGYWDSIHPELRESADPAEAALRRRNAIQQIENDGNGLLGDLEMNVMFSRRGIGPVRGEDLALGSLSEFEYMSEAPAGLGAKEEAALRARHGAIVARVTSACRALAGESPEEAQALLADLGAADAARQALEKTFTEKAGLVNGMGLRLARLGTLLTRAAASVRAGLAAGETAATTETATMPAPSAATGGPSPATAPAVAAALPGQVTSRGDVERMLDLIIAFYERTEPSSPIPHLARRMRRMVAMDFLQLMEEIAPSGLKEFKNVAGVDDKRKSD